ncbi:MAG: hypothetical protein ABH862_01365 [Candidatus Omnitrophota bacterium]
MKRIYLAGVMLSSFIFCYCAYADIVHLKDGRSVTGKVVSQDVDIVEIEIGGGTVIHRVEEVEHVEETAEDIVFKPKEKSSLEKFIDGIKRKVEQYFRKRRIKKATKELHDLRLKEYEFTKKQEESASNANKSRLPIADLMGAAQNAAAAANYQNNLIRREIESVESENNR